jgi:hypothetical protein
VYSAAVTGNATAKHLCFDEGNGVVYKGDGSIQFTCYFPFARSRYKWLSQYTFEHIPEWNNEDIYKNIGEWSEGSGLLFAANKITESSPNLLPVVDSYAKGKNGGTIRVFNPGDIPTDF